MFFVVRLIFAEKKQKKSQKKSQLQKSFIFSAVAMLLGLISLVCVIVLFIQVSLFYVILQLT